MSRVECKIRALVMLPVRELAVQVCPSIDLSLHPSVRLSVCLLCCLCIVGPDESCGV